MVVGAYYAIHSMNIPDIQTNGTLNLCFRSVENHIQLNSGCHYFKVVNGFLKSAKPQKVSLAFESACLPGYYLTQRNYGLVLAAKEKTTKFGNK